jgi:formylglycine-generating enzyme required for sulfatase activity
MVRLMALFLPLLFSLATLAQGREDLQFHEAGVCARCHVISVVEWGISAHRKANTGCVACHGASQQHVADERNNIKPDRVPHEMAITNLCAGCHQTGCPKTDRVGSCQNCHHVHALVNPDKPPMPRDERLEELTTRRERFSDLMGQGEDLVKAEKWVAAQQVFRQALAQEPGDRHATARLRMCERRQKPSLAGCEIVGQEFDPQIGVPHEVRVAGLGISLILVPGGEFEMGSDRFAGASPVHTVQINAFYLGKYEITQAEWKSLMGSNPSAHQGTGDSNSDRMPIERVSWEDCQAFLKELNEHVEGGGFRLPTEAEWEYAARAGSGATENIDLPAPKPVGQGYPNQLGLFDMLGNVWEWCSSLDRPYPYVAADGREMLEVAGLRILRGGGYADLPGWFDAGTRHSERPTQHLKWNGVRVARSLPSQF